MTDPDRVLEVAALYFYNFNVNKEDEEQSDQMAFFFDFDLKREYFLSGCPAIDEMVKNHSEGISSYVRMFPAISEYFTPEEERAAMSQFTMNLKDVLISLRSGWLARKMKEIALFMTNAHVSIMDVRKDGLPPEGVKKKIETIEEKIYELGHLDLGKSLRDILPRKFARQKIITSGFESLDRLTGGFEKSDLIIIAARPSMGKTAFALNMFYRFGRAGIPTVFFSLEMSADQLGRRLLSIGSGVPLFRINSANMSPSESTKLSFASEELSGFDLYLEDRSYMTLKSLRFSMKRYVKRFGVKCVIIDYLHLMTSSVKSANRTQEISELTMGLKNIAKELGVVVIALSQLSRAVELREDKRPFLADLRDSGTIEQDADMVMFLYREEYYESRKGPRKGETEDERRIRLKALEPRADIFLQKNRKGAIGDIVMDFNIYNGTFKDKSA